MKRRSPYTITPQDMDDYNAANATQKRILLKALRVADLDALSSGQAMGNGGSWDYCQQGYKSCIEYPKIYDDEEVDIDLYGNSIDLATFLVKSMKDEDTIVAWLGILFGLAGRDLMEDTTHVRLRANKKRGKNIEYVEPSNALNKMFEERAAKADTTRKTNDIIKDLQEQLAKKG